MIESALMILFAIGMMCLTLARWPKMPSMVARSLEALVSTLARNTRWR